MNDVRGCVCVERRVCLCVRVCERASYECLCMMVADREQGMRVCARSVDELFLCDVSVLCACSLL